MIIKDLSFHEFITQVNMAGDEKDFGISIVNEGIVEAIIVTVEMVEALIVAAIRGTSIEDDSLNSILPSMGVVTLVNLNCAIQV